VLLNDCFWPAKRVRRSTSYFPLLIDFENTDKHLAGIYVLMLPFNDSSVLQDVSPLPAAWCNKGGWGDLKCTPKPTIPIT
jgi:hypothetical protein